MEQKLHKPVFPWGGDSSPRLLFLVILIQGGVWGSKGIKNHLQQVIEGHEGHVEKRSSYRGTLSLLSYLSSSDSADSFSKPPNFRDSEPRGCQSNGPLPTFCQSGMWGMRYPEGSEGNGKVKGEAGGVGFWTKGGNRLRTRPKKTLNQLGESLEQLVTPGGPSSPVMVDSIGWCRNLGCSNQFQDGQA